MIANQLTNLTIGLLVFSARVLVMVVVVVVVMLADILDRCYS